VLVAALKPAYVLQAARPQQWTKNLVLFAAIVFSRKFGEIPARTKVAAAYAIFCTLSSSIYLFNDVVDAPQDKLHPLKSQRPIAAGKIGRNEALGWALALLVAALRLLPSRAVSSGRAEEEPAEKKTNRSRPETKRLRKSNRMR
jgi:4-hydroxybenzoate polyprenyltransferase